MSYLLDTSALVRIVRGQTDPAWDDLAERGMLAICEPVLVETLAISDANDYVDNETDIRGTYPWVPVPDSAWDLVAGVRRDLAAKSQHQGPSVADYLIVATAIQFKLTVPHEDGDFETMARLVPRLRQRRLTTAS